VQAQRRVCHASDPIDDRSTHPPSRLAAIGGGIGILVSLVATRSIEAHLWGVERSDPLTLILVGALLGAASALIALSPGLRAARMEPRIALRSE
jgi:ABC-type antimicrobial peptide transport system permease subunit